MTHRLHHEQIYRGSAAIQRLAETPIFICGVGALGSHLAVNLLRSGASKMTVIDRDRVEEQNVGTQIYSLEDVGARKADILRNVVFREVGLEINAVPQELNDRNVGKLLKGARLVVDTFDNSASRQCVTDYCRSNGVDCLHAGINDEYGQIVWSERYRVPSDAGVDVCDYPLARNLILLVVAVSGEAILRFLTTGEKNNYSITLRDLSINQDFDS